MKRKRKGLPPRLAILWSERELTRFVEAVERFAGLVNDLAALLAEPKRRAEAAAATRRAKQAALEAGSAAAELVDLAAAARPPDVLPRPGSPYSPANPADRTGLDYKPGCERPT